MAGDEAGEEAPPKVNDWEVVNLTASAYAASPGPTKPIDLNHDCRENEIKASSPMFMSAHFVCPPSQHENLPPEMNDVKCGESDIPQLNAGEEEGVKSDMIKDDSDASFNEFHKDMIFYGKGSEGFQEDAVFDEEESVSGTAEFQSSRFEETDARFLDVEEEMFDCEDLPCEAWWKRMAVSLYSQSKEANSFWTVLITAAVMGIVIIGHHGHKKKAAACAN